MHLMCLPLFLDVVYYYISCTKQQFSWYND